VNTHRKELQHTVFSATLFTFCSLQGAIVIVEVYQTCWRDDRTSR